MTDLLPSGQHTHQRLLVQWDKSGYIMQQEHLLQPKTALTTPGQLVHSYEPRLRRLCLSEGPGFDPPTLVITEIPQLVTPLDGVRPSCRMLVECWISFALFAHVTVHHRKTRGGNKNISIQTNFLALFFKIISSSVIDISDLHFRISCLRFLNLMFFHTHAPQTNKFHPQFTT